jgi:hypothetical protein
MPLLYGLHIGCDLFFVSLIQELRNAEDENDL